MDSYISVLGALVIIIGGALIIRHIIQQLRD